MKARSLRTTLRAAWLSAPVIGLVVMAAACVDGGTPTDCDAPAVTRAARLADGRLVPQNVAVCRGQQVTLILEVGQDGIFHVHGYDDALPATEVRAGETTELEFTADRAGQFVIELHAMGADEGGEVGILTVHER
jgi:hypothetical protein